jgi:acyl-CoA hydrolase
MGVHSEMLADGIIDLVECGDHEQVQGGPPAAA